jgi:hypothetical protein
MLISCFFNHVRGNAARPASDNGSARLTFFSRERLVSFVVTSAAVRNRESSPMTFIGPIVSRLSVLTAYLAIAFVGAIVLGLF